VDHESGGEDDENEYLDIEPHAVVQDENGDAEDAEKENNEEAAAMQVDSPAKMSNAPATETHKPSPERPALFAQIFDLDGANDEPLPEVSYPTLSKDEPSPPATIPDEQTVSQNSDTQLQWGSNAQLPTPADTQLSEKVLSPDASFSSTAEVLHMTEEQQSISHEKHIDARESVSKADMESKDAKTDIQDLAVNFVESGSTETMEITEGTAGFTIEEIAGEGQTDEMEITITEKAAAVSQDSEQMAIDEAAPEETIDEDIEVSATEEAPSISIPENEDETKRRDYSETATTDEALMEEITTDYVAQQRNGHIESALEEPKFTVNAPRRSHRRIRSTSKSIANAKEKPTISAANFKEKPVISSANTEENERPGTTVNTRANTKENGRPRTPVNTRGARRKSILDDQLSPMVVLDSRATPKGHDASAELALQADDSPSKPLHDLRKQPVTDLKLLLSRHLRTELSEFTSLKVLRYHIKQKLDVLAVATTTPPEPQRAKGGPRHYSVTFNITDPSIAPSGVTEVQVFRPYKDALPNVEAGDGILLRNFQVVSVKRGFALQSLQAEGSSWAVFKESEDPEIRGPPVELGVREKNHVVSLKDWYQRLDSLSVQKINRANADKGKS
jgi:hypothetical protein